MGKGELFVMSNFSFSHSVFKRLVLHTCKNQGLFGKGLKHLNKHEINSLPNNKILDQSNLKDFADNNINVTYATNFDIGRGENIVRIGENAGYQHFSPFPTMFSKAFLSRGVKSQNCVVKG